MRAYACTHIPGLYLQHAAHCPKNAAAGEALVGPSVFGHAGTGRRDSAAGRQQRQAPRLSADPSMPHVGALTLLVSLHMPYSAVETIGRLRHLNNISYVRGASPLQASS